jgi:tRNA pseudouridine38-40 synthase
MRNIKLNIQYDGTKYKGWQKLGDDTNTIQYKIEKVLSELTGEEIDLIASGRTDAGVHARNQIANFKTKSNVTNEEILDYCYRYLPLDIVVQKCENASWDFHSRYNAKKKIYTYKIYNNKFHDIFNRKYSHHVKERLDISKMRDMASLFIGEHDFKSFTALKSKKKSTVREIYSIDFIQNGKDIDIVFVGNGFLYKMIRILVGTLIEAGLNRITKEDVQKIMLEKDRSIAPPTAPSHGLFLTDVIY